MASTEHFLRNRFLIRPRRTLHELHVTLDAPLQSRSRCTGPLLPPSRGGLCSPQPESSLMKIRSRDNDPAAEQARRVSVIHGTPCFRTLGTVPAVRIRLRVCSPRTCHHHMLQIGFRPRGFSPPRRFGLQLRSGNFAPQPDRIHIVSGSSAALSDL